LLKINPENPIIYRILAIDFQQAAFGIIYSDWSYDILWEKKSLVPRKIGVGGQSQQRFQNARESAIIMWYHKLDELLTEIQGDIVLAMSDIFSQQFLNNISTQNRNKITKRISLEYSGSDGIIQTVHRLQDEKKNP
jgi:peptide subunit release factor 1 (eRF1)